MTNEQYGYWLGTIWAAIPGGIGMWGILAGITQGRIGPVLVGILFLAIAYVTYKIFYNAAQKWVGKE